jgi:FKBP-type peptidyl-prolyl cis-trans isomerase
VRDGIAARFATLATAVVMAATTTPAQDRPPAAALPTHGDPARTTFAAELGVDLATMRRLPSGVYVRDIEEGRGATAAPGRQVTLGYILYLADGAELERASTVGFVIGEGRVIRGWDVGMRGMRAGGTRLLVVPARLAYGSEGTEKVPPHAVLVFVVSLDAVR